METLVPQLIKVLGIIWINIILSGDNAVVIALACRGLPADKRRVGMILGAGVARRPAHRLHVRRRRPLSTPYLKIVGGLLLLWIAVKLLTDDDEQDDVKSSDRLWHAVWTIAVADAVHESRQRPRHRGRGAGFDLPPRLGLAISIPLIIAGAALIMALLERRPSSSGPAPRCSAGSRAR